MVRKDSDTPIIYTHKEIQQIAQNMGVSPEAVEGMILSTLRAHVGLLEGYTNLTKPEQDRLELKRTELADAEGKFGQTARQMEISLEVAGKQVDSVSATRRRRSHRKGPGKKR